MTNMDLLSALISNYEPRVQKGLLCSKFNCTQDVLGYLSKVQGLQENRDNFKAPRCDNPSGDANRRPQHGSRPDERPRNRGNIINVRFVRTHSGRRNSGFSNRRNRNSGETEFYERRQGRLEGDSSGQLNPNAQRFDPRVGATPINSDRNDRSHNNEAQTLNENSIPKPNQSDIRADRISNRNLNILELVKTFEFETLFELTTVNNQQRVNGKYSNRQNRLHIIYSWKQETWMSEIINKNQRPVDICIDGYGLWIVYYEWTSLQYEGVAIKKPDCFYYPFPAMSMTKRRVGYWPMDFPLPSHKGSFTHIG
jgi:hypothetical protein